MAGAVRGRGGGHRWGAGKEGEEGKGMAEAVTSRPTPCHTLAFFFLLPGRIIPS